MTKQQNTTPHTIEEEIGKKIKNLRQPFDQKVYAIPYAGNLFEEQAKKIVTLVSSHIAETAREEERERVIEEIDKQKEEARFPSGYLKSQVHVVTRALEKLKHALTPTYKGKDEEK